MVMEVSAPAPPVGTQAPLLKKMINYQGVCVCFVLFRVMLHLFQAGLYRRTRGVWLGFAAAQVLRWCNALVVVAPSTG